jgi:creatinine amidohydrolase
LPWRAWADLASPDLPPPDDATVALLPLGATEQHGPHLPLATDTLICEAIVDAAIARGSGAGMVLRLPTQAVGVSVEHGRFPGTLSLEPETAIAVLSDLGRSVAAAGVRKMILFNAHGGQPQIVDIVAQKLRRERAMLVVRANYFRFGLPAAAPVISPGRDLHGGLIETSLMLAIAPALVRGDRLRNFPSRAERLEAGCRVFEVEGATGIGWMAEDLNDEGVVGDAASASATVGRMLLDHYAGKFATLIEEVQGLAWTPAAPPSRPSGW